MSEQRAECERIVAAHTTRVEQYAAVSRDDARRLLGDDVYAKLTADRIRNLGPSPETLYPWNVADFLQHKIQKEG
jgi:hypothetical protein